MKVFITGSGGFIGNYIKKRLEKEYEIIAWSRKDHDLTKPLPMHEIDIIIHIAGGMPFENQEDVLSKNMLVTLNVLDFAKKQKKLKHFIYFSTYLVYGEGDSDEDVPCRPCGLYSACKFSCEKLLETACLPLTILRIACVYGKGQNENCFISKCIKHVGQDKPLVIYSGNTSFLHVEDLCDFVNILCRGEPYGILNIVGQKITTIEIANIIEKISGKPLHIIKKQGVDRDITSKNIHLTGWEFKRDIRDFIFQVFLPSTF